MKRLKRILLRPFYFWYWIFHKRPVRFELLLIRNGFWRLANPLKDFKVIVPKSYYEFIKKYPDIKPYYPELRILNTPTTNNTFYHYEAPKEDKK